MKKLAAILLLSLASCELQYDAGTRYIVDAHVQDRNGAPLPNILVDVVVNNSTDEETIAGSRTDENGNILLTFPRPRSGTVSVYVNGRLFQDSENEFQSRYTDLDSIAFANYKYVIETATLFRSDEITNLTISYDDSDPAYTSVGNLSVEGLIADRNLDTDEIIGNNSYMPTLFTVVENSTIILHYSLRNSSGGQTQFNVPVTIGNGPAQYTITY